MLIKLKKEIKKQPKYGMKIIKNTKLNIRKKTEKNIYNI